MKKAAFLVGAVAVWATVIIAAAGGGSQRDSRVLMHPNYAGEARTFSPSRAIDLNNPFFQDLGSNKRTCASCHQPDSAWSITPENLEHRFQTSKGNDAVFRSNDGANCEGAIANTV